MTLEDAIRDLIKEKFGSVPKFADSIEEPPTSIYGALSRGMKNTRTELTDKIYKGLRIDMNSVCFDETQELKLLDDERYEYATVSLFGSIAAGTPIEMMRSESMRLIPMELHKMYPDAFYLRVEGESMNNVIPNGSYALINPTNEVIDGKVYAVCVNGFDATIKRVRKLNNGFELRPDSDDPTYKPAIYDYGVEGTETVTVIGQVVWYSIPYDWEF